MTLKEKIDLSMARMRRMLELYGPDTTVGWTGGKDSTAVLYLWRMVLAETAPGTPVRALNLDTGCKFPEVLRFRDRLAGEWNIDLHIVRSGIELHKYPLAADPVTCCRDLKISPLAAAIAELKIPALLTGVRADENPQRHHRHWLEEHTGHVRAMPILEWSELDIWTFQVRHSIPWCGLYDQGFRSLGCVPCTSRSGHGERSGRDGRKERQMEQLHSLGYF